MALAGGGASEGVIVAAEEQSAGRGRKGRSWISSPGKSLTVSLLLRPARMEECLTLLFALAAARSLDDVGAQVRIKWPNDLRIGHRKLAGILAEAMGGVLVIGLGMNVNEDAEDFPPPVSGEAISLSLASGARHDRGIVLAGVIRTFEGVYRRWEREGFSPFVPEIEERILYLGEEISLDEGSGRVTGRMLGLAPDGRLRILVESREAVFSAGDLTLRGER
jgi:BirA family biotin operon repressor/biotin-[acetyl-CoA-carboxylase] ligase